MDMGRCFFAWSQMVNKTFYATLALFVVFGMFELFILPHAGLTVGGILRLSVGATFLGYYLYWLRFYYKMYEVTSVRVPVDWIDLDHPPARLQMKVLVGHRHAFERKVRAEDGTILKHYHHDKPNAILFSGDIVVMADGDFTYKEIHVTLHADYIRRGARWNNNFSFHDGTPGFIDMNTGRFYNIVRHLDANQNLHVITVK